MVQFSMTLTDL